MSKVCLSLPLLPVISPCVGRFNNDGLVQGDILHKVSLSCRSRHPFRVNHAAHLSPCKTHPLFDHAREKCTRIQLRIVQCSARDEQKYTLQSASNTNRMSVTPEKDDSSQFDGFSLY